MPKEPQQPAYPIRIQVETAGIWRAEQVARTLLAIDGLASRVGMASYIAESCEAYDWAITSLGMFGLLERPEKWKKPKSPSDLELRNGLGAFVSLMRNAGVSVDISRLGVRFSFLVDDVYDLVPVSARAEVEAIKMASPGSWSLLIPSALKSPAAVRLVEKLFDALFFHGAARRRSYAEARHAEAEAKHAEAKAKEAGAKASLAVVKARREEARLLLDYAVALDSLLAGLRNAGFDNNQIERVLNGRISDDMKLLGLHKSLGLITGLTVVPIESGAKTPRK